MVRESYKSRVDDFLQLILHLKLERNFFRLIKKRNSHYLIKHTVYLIVMNNEYLFA